MKDLVLSLPDGGYEVRFLERGADNNGRRLATEWSVDAYSGPPVHWHPVMRESWEVLDGSLAVTIDGIEHRVSAGESAVAEPGVRHSFRKDGPGVVRWRQTNEPALDHELLFLLDYERARRRGADGAPGPVESIRILALMDGYVVGPPIWVQRILIGIGNLLNRGLRNRRADS